MDCRMLGFVVWTKAGNVFTVDPYDSRLDLQLHREKEVCMDCTVIRSDCIKQKLTMKKARLQGAGCTLDKKAEK
jgi:hypothetical protein